MSGEILQNLCNPEILTKAKVVLYTGATEWISSRGSP